MAAIIYIASLTTTSLKILEKDKYIHKSIDKYSKHYNECIFVGDLNAQDLEPCLQNSFMDTMSRILSRKTRVLKTH